MNSHTVVKIFFSNSFEYSNSKSLCDLSCIRTQEMETDYFLVLIFFHNQLCIGVMIIICLSIIVQIPFKRLVNTAISDNILCTEFLSCLFFTITTTSIFDWCENSSWNIFIAHFSGSLCKQSVSQHFTCHNSGWSQLQSSLTDVSNSIDVRNISLIVVFS